MTEENFTERLPEELAAIVRRARDAARNTESGLTGLRHRRQILADFNKSLKTGLDLARRTQNWDVVRDYKGERRTVRLTLDKDNLDEIARLQMFFRRPRYQIIGAALHYARKDYTRNILAAADGATHYGTTAPDRNETDGL